MAFPIAIVTSRFNEPVTTALYEGARGRLDELGFSEDQITSYFVPGAVEIPLIAKRIAQKGEVKAIVTLGAVIQGETKHFDYVCDALTQGIVRVSLDHNIPVIFGVLTTNNSEQAFDRVGGRKGHKGVEAIDAAMAMVAACEKIG